MKQLSALKFVLPFLVVAFAFMSCDDNNPVGTFEDVANRIPNVDLIPGGENATMNVKYDRQYSYFTIDVENVGFNTDVSDGIYAAWCAQIDKSMTIDQDLVGTKLYNTRKDERFNQLSYIVNNRRTYERELPGLSWKDIQVSFWVILETEDYNLATIADRVSSSTQGYNAEYVNAIIDDVLQNGKDFTPGFGDTKLVLMTTNGEVQDPIIEVNCETAMVRMNDDPDDFDWLWDGHSWFSYVTVGPLPVDSDVHTFYYYAAQSYRVGEVDIWRNEDGDLRIHIRLEDPDGNPLYDDLGDLIVTDESHVNVQLDDEEYSPPAQFGQWPYSQEHEGATEVNYTIPWESEWEDQVLYIAVHSVVCGAVEEWMD